MHQVPVEHVLALLLQAEHGVDLVAALAGHDRGQEVHEAGGHLHVHHEVGPVQAEQRQQHAHVEQDGVDEQAAVGVVQHRHRERVFLAAVDRPADHVGALVAVEGRGKHLDLEVRFGPGPFAEMALHGVEQVADVAVQVGERAVPAEVQKDLPQRRLHAVAQRVVAAVGGRIRFDVIGRDGRPEEDEVVVEIGAVHDPAEHRVEEGLRQFRLLVLGEQADVVQLGMAPGQVVHRLGAELAAQPFDRLGHALVVELDALLDRVLLSQPGAGLEPPLALLAGLAVQPVVLVEPVQDRLGDGLGDGAGVPRRHVVAIPHGGLFRSLGVDACTAAPVRSRVPASKIQFYHPLNTNDRRTRASAHK